MRSILSLIPRCDMDWSKLLNVLEARVNPGDIVAFAGCFYCMQWCRGLSAPLLRIWSLVNPAGLVPVLFLLRFVTLWRAHPTLGSFRSDKKCGSNCMFMVELEWTARNQDDDVAKSYILHCAVFQWNAWNPNPTSRCIKFFACFDLFVLLLNHVKSTMNRVFSRR